MTLISALQDLEAGYGYLNSLMGCFYAISLRKSEELVEKSALTVHVADTLTSSGSINCSKKSNQAGTLNSRLVQQFTVATTMNSNPINKEVRMKSK